MSKISIVSPYFNRKPELYRTLKSIEKSSIRDIEYIVVDDGSGQDHRIEDFVSVFRFLRLFRIEPENKKHINPCIPFNMGISKAGGDIVILQSPECMHVGDVLKYAFNNIRKNQYMVFSCFSLSKKSSDNLSRLNFNMTSDKLKASVIDAIGGLTDDSAEGPAGRNNSWFAHSVYRKCIFNFLVAMTREDLYDLGGFDERFANGHGYDDTDFSARVKKKGMQIIMVDDPFCLHQHHRSFLTEFKDFKAKEALNREIYEATLKSSNYKVHSNIIMGRYY